jgi:glycosyltransferase involved in cell wall biosynthesis
MMTNLRVLQLISSEGFYGAETMLLNLARTLGGLGCEVVVGAFDNQHRTSKIFAERVANSGIRVASIQCRRRFDWHAIQEIRRIIRELNIDVVNVHGYKADFYGWAAVKGLGVPLVATCHAWQGRNLRLNIYAHVDHKLMKSFDALVAVSESIASLMRRFGISENRIHMIGNGVDINRFRLPKTHSPNCAAAEKITIGVVGRLIPIKGMEYAIRAFRDVHSRFPNTSLAIIGGGPLLSKLQSLASQMGLSENVTFLGERHDMPEVYASMDVFVLPSLDEGTSMAILEAMAAGKPIVATDVGGTPLVVRHEQNGLLVQPKNVEALSTAILRLLEEPGLSMRLAANGMRYVEEHFSDRSMGRQYRDLYERLAGVTPVTEQAAIHV